MRGCIRATFWDFGGVVSASPFEAFARYEREHGLPDGFLRGLNATNPDTNAWAALERGQITIDEFCDRFEAEAAATGERIDARDVIGLLGGDVRPAMVEAVRRCRAAGLRTACLTNNFVTDDGAPRPRELRDLFDVVLESSRAGVRKPDPRFYELACELTGVAAREAVFLDDLGVNLKPARAMGMTTIKVTDPDAAIDQLQDVLGIALRAARS